MAIRARRGDTALAFRRMDENMRRLKTGRPRRGHVPSPTWAVEGIITDLRYCPPALITIDPGADGDYPEFKQIIGFDGFLESGEVTVNWKSNDGYIYEGHVITTGGGGDNRVMLPTPFIIANGAYGGEFIQPEIDAATGAENLSCIAIIETIPI